MIGLSGKTKHFQLIAFLIAARFQMPINAGNGWYKATARDYDGNGNLDIAV